MARLLQEYLGKYGEFFKKEAVKTADKFEDTYVVDGVVRWKSNDRIPPTDILELWHYIGKEFDYEKSLQVSDEETQKSIQAYRERRAARGYSQEELFEMGAAFGNVPVVDVLTGKRIGGR